MKRKLILVTVTILVILAVVGGIAINVLSVDEEVQLKAKTDQKVDLAGLVEQEIDYQESLNTVSNPDRGFYYPAIISGTATGFDYSQLTDVIDQMKSTKCTLVHLRVNASKLSGRANGKKDFALSKEDIADLNVAFSLIRENKFKAIVRIAYNYDGIQDKEPDSLDTILQHIEQFKPIFQDNKDVITVVETGFVGPWGEMHSSDYANMEDISKIVKSLLAVVPDSITVNVRTVEMLKAFGDEPRVGLFNDGYLGNELDLGTYTKREEDIKFLESHTNTIFGGEVVCPESKFNDIKNVDEMFRTRTTYLNYLWNPEITQDKWEKSTYNGSNSIYKGQTAKKYIEDHLGYRFVLKCSKIATANNEIQLSFQVENTGFSNLVNSYKCDLIIKCKNNHYVASTDINLKEWGSNEIATESVSLEIPSKLKGEASIYLKIYNNQYSIQFANEGVWDETLNANYIGKVK